ncbi:tetraspanin-9-like [Palaemon carinicauda]|uniref:tetraspanin-9-like n=1 Tax=Palaemon carinicauda TaxID=392227 RepID=UPI0035B64BCB
MGLFTKVALFFVNFIVMVLGLAMVITASIFLSNGNNFDFLINEDTFSLPIFSLVIGIVMLILCLMGCYGASKENRLIVKINGGLLCILVIAQLVVGILILINAFVPVESIQNEMNNTFFYYGVEDQEMKENIDTFQIEAGCCGVHDYTDWALYPFGEANNNSVPDSCCKEDYYKDGCGLNVLSKEDFEEVIFNKGCSYSVTGILVELGLLLGILCILFVIIQLVSVCCVCGLAMTPKTSSNRQVVITKTVVSYSK